VPLVGDDAAETHAYVRATKVIKSDGTTWEHEALHKEINHQLDEALARPDFMQILDHPAAQQLSINSGRYEPVATADGVEPNLSCPAELRRLRVSTLCSVVKNAAITAIIKAEAKMANTVRWVFIIDPPIPSPWDREPRVPSGPYLYRVAFLN
jgi:hypothetical protein